MDDAGRLVSTAPCIHCHRRVTGVQYCVLESESTLLDYLCVTQCRDEPPPKKNAISFPSIALDSYSSHVIATPDCPQSGAMQAISEEDYYKILGVNRKANEAEINKVRSDLCSTALMRV